MATAIAAPLEEHEQLVDQPRKVSTFIARRQNLRLIKVKRRQIRNASGDVVDESQGETIPFVVYIDPVRLEQLRDGGMDVREAQAAARYGRFECPTEGTVVLEDGREVDAADVHEFLLRHRLNGDTVEGFWRLNPTAPAMSPVEARRISRAAARHEIELLEEIIRQERAGWGRDDVINAAQDALDEIAAIHAEIAAEDAAKAAEKPAKPEPKPKG